MGSGGLDILQRQPVLHEIITGLRMSFLFVRKVCKRLAAERKEARPSVRKCRQPGGLCLLSLRRCFCDVPLEPLGMLLLFLGTREQSTLLVELFLEAATLKLEFSVVRAEGLAELRIALAGVQQLERRLLKLFQCC